MPFLDEGPSTIGGGFASPGHLGDEVRPPGPEVIEANNLAAGRYRVGVAWTADGADPGPISSEAVKSTPRSRISSYTSDTTINREHAEHF